MSESLRQFHVVGVVAVLALAGCTTVRLTEPAQTATQQLLVSVAVDHAVEQLNPIFPAGTKIFVDAQYFEGGDSTLYAKYAVGSIRDRLLQRGARLVDNRASADIIAELRSGGQSINHRDFLIGIPSIPLPIPLAGTVLTPKVTFFDRDQQTGIAKLALTAYDKDGALTTSSGAVYGTSTDMHWSALLFISGGKTDVLPKDVKR
jgi:hypothetical protein